MIKKISSGQLKLGMYIHDLCCHWMEHPFARNRFLITSEREVEKILQAGIRELYIDTGKGLDAPDAPTAQEVREKIESQMVDLAARQATPIRISLAEEMDRARRVRQQAHQVVRSVMHDARLGKAVELDRVEPVVEEITTSILRNPGALAALLHIKTKDDYTFLHSVSVCTLMVAFCRSAGLDAATTRQAGLGGLLHDIGKSLVPDAVLNKPGRLTDEEFALIQRHPQDGHEILSRTPGIGAIPLDITLHHHERVDGSGYPGKHAGDAISQLARMAAIIDVYDALTSERCYHKAISAAEALRKLHEWSRFHFDPQLVQAFTRTVGIYPVGTLVLMESGRLGVVTGQHASNLLTPTVKVFFSTRSNTYIPPQEVDLARPLGSGGADRIMSHESAAKWRVDPMRFLAA
ncbi:HD-GYP domain, c-di-GMP phosphodiesterase class II (or its inactivated variant) [Noviherbaspirillum humi]|uniref:HD-GYP domain, c-di-GMP phosphodiesterase class II (Or its inactivated variant) n=1 Tax=Noviherbaspirillum humi TaxID=1688639 RepID=A0A239L8E2_9BURK|nr:HD-GYP domain-containing protein [Noviherbaspirillum humi]SNT26168.1 HD-GYP domain, c-di-GMP phosphodiesterase class II (or its inactivated variant) [Noviherbaspirillum humi]